MYAQVQPAVAQRGRRGAIQATMPTAKEAPATSGGHSHAATAQIATPLTTTSSVRSGLRGEGAFDPVITGSPVF